MADGVGRVRRATVPGAEVSGVARSFAGEETGGKARRYRLARPRGRYEGKPLERARRDDFRECCRGNHGHQRKSEGYADPPRQGTFRVQPAILSVQVPVGGNPRVRPPPMAERLPLIKGQAIVDPCRHVAPHRGGHDAGNDRDEERGYEEDEAQHACQSRPSLDRRRHAGAFRHGHVVRRFWIDPRHEERQEREALRTTKTTPSRTTPTTPKMTTDRSRRGTAGSETGNGADRDSSAPFARASRSACDGVHGTHPNASRGEETRPSPVVGGHPPRCARSRSGSSPGR